MSFRQVSDAPLLIWASRDEARRRPTQPPAVRVHPTAGTHWLGGLDQRAGGTWLGVNEFGMLISVTNRRRLTVPPRFRSRGLLCRDLLACREAGEALELSLRELGEDCYDGCNILIASPSEAAFVSAVEQVEFQHLTPGLHVVANGPLNDPDDRRAQRLRRKLEEAEASCDDAMGWFEAGSRLLGMDAEGDEPALVLTGATRGTVSATCVALAEDAGRSMYLYADGPPHATAYHDYSPLLRELLTGRSD